MSGPRRGLVARAAVCALSVGAALMQTGCGIEYIPYLRRPDVRSGIFAFGTNTDTDLYFLGYEVYYKLYSEDQTDEVDAQSNLATLAALRTAGYRRLTPDPDVAADPDAEPLVAVPSSVINSPHTVTVRFADVPEGEPQAVGDWPTDVPLALRRGVQYPVNEDPNARYETFADIDANDADISSEVWAQIAPPATARINIALYALAYGFDEATFTQIHSEPTYLGLQTIEVGIQTP